MQAQPEYVCFVVMFVLVMQTFIVMFALEYFVSGHDSIRLFFGITLQKGYSNWLNHVPVLACSYMYTARALLYICDVCVSI